MASAYTYTYTCTPPEDDDVIYEQPKNEWTPVNLLEMLIKRVCMTFIAFDNKYQINYRTNNDIEMFSQILKIMGYS